MFANKIDHNHIEDVCNIVHKYITEEVVNRAYKEPQGWLNKVLLSLTDFHLHPLQIALGKKFERIFREVTGLTYDVPKFIAGHGVSQAEAEAYIGENQRLLKNGDVPILTRLNLGDLEVATTEFWESFRALRLKTKSARLSHKQFEDFSDDLLNVAATQDTIAVLRVDFAMNDGDTCVLSELRSSGYTDTRKSYDTLKHMLNCFVAIGNVKKRMYLGIITNSTGNKSSGEWNGNLGGQVESDVILIEDELWDMIAPPDVYFDEFKSMVSERIFDLLPEKHN